MSYRDLSDKDLPTLDPSKPEHEFLSYLECCESLGVKPSVRKFARYQELWVKSHGE